MFIVKDLKVLKEYGFIHSSGDTYYKPITEKDSVKIELLVNPSSEHVQDEILVCVTSDEIKCCTVDFTASLRVLAKMVKNGDVIVK